MTEEKPMVRRCWRTLAIIMIVLFLGLSAYVCWGVYLVVEDEKVKQVCYYDICEEYPDAYYAENLCTCYSIDEYGEYEIAKSEPLN